METVHSSGSVRCENYFMTVAEEDLEKVPDTLLIVDYENAAHVMSLGSGSRERNPLKCVAMVG